MQINSIQQRVRLALQKTRVEQKQQNEINLQRSFPWRNRQIRTVEAPVNNLTELLNIPSNVLVVETPKGDIDIADLALHPQAVTISCLGNTLHPKYLEEQGLPIGDTPEGREFRNLRGKIRDLGTVLDTVWEAHSMQSTKLQSQEQMQAFYEHHQGKIPSEESFYNKERTMRCYYQLPLDAKYAFFRNMFSWEISRMPPPYNEKHEEMLLENFTALQFRTVVIQRGSQELVDALIYGLPIPELKLPEDVPS